MDLNLNLLDKAVAKTIRPWLIDQGNLVNPAIEGYHHQKVIPKAKPHLSRESIEGDPQGSLLSALKPHTNLLSQFEYMESTAFLKAQDNEAIRGHALDLLFGTDQLVDRIRRFNLWSKPKNVEPGKRVGINVTAIGYLLAMSDPTRYAFCKPEVYEDAAKHLLGTAAIKDRNERLAHATDFYKAALHEFQTRYHLPFTDLQHVHIAFWVMHTPQAGLPGWENLSENPDPDPPPPMPMHDLNIILYGPPGTGKTYDTIRRAVEICDGSASSDRKKLVERYEELRKENRVYFVTFHQAYSYEDFVEGIRPVLEDNAPAASEESGELIRYECRPGIFKQLCELAGSNPTVSTGGTSIDWEGTTVWKMSLGDTDDPEQARIYRECMQQNVVRLAYGMDLNFEDCQTRLEILEKLRAEDPHIKPTDFNVTAIDSLKLGMKKGDLVIISDGNREFRAVGRIEGPYKFLDSDTYPQSRPVEWLLKLKDSLPREVIYNKQLSQMTIYRLSDEQLRREALAQLLSPAPAVARNYVLIIDEINRGNIAKILGELITLLEPDKRIGAANFLDVILPYSAKPFGVPKNVYVIGTMNTADRSIAFLDVALRRRFKFVELMPNYQLVRTHWSQQRDAAAIDLAQVLEVINARIELLYDSDHQIGHAFFLSVKSITELRDVFCGKVIPLLQEYFYGDWSKVCLVLGCPVNPESNVIQPNPNPLVVARSLNKAAKLPDSDEIEERLRFSVNAKFASAETAGDLQPFFAAILNTTTAS